MAQSRLRIYYGPPSETARGETREPKHAPCSVTLSVEDVLPLLADAVESRRTWLRDFGEDEITISTDLYEVLLAYQHFRRPSA